MGQEDLHFFFLILRKIFPNTNGSGKITGSDNSFHMRTVD